MPKLDENDPKSVAAMQDPNHPLLQEIERLREENASLRGSQVIDGKFAGEAPRYKLNDPVYFSDTHIPAGSIIEWWGPANASMVPQNEPAKRAAEAFLESQVNGQRMKAEMRGRPFTGYVEDRGVLLAQMHQDAREDSQRAILAIPQERGVVPLMPHTPEAQALEKRRPGRPRKQLGSVTPPPEPLKRVAPPDQAALASPYFVPDSQAG